MKRLFSFPESQALILKQDLLEYPVIPHYRNHGTDYGRVLVACI